LQTEEYNLKKQNFACLSIAALMVTCSIAVPEAYCLVSSPESNFDLSDWNTGSTYKYQASVSTAVAQAYSGGLMVKTVSELRLAYDLNALYAAGYDGKGQTIVIVDAYGSPTIYEDLLYFITWQNSYGANLPWTTMDQIKQHVQIYYPFGKPTFDASDPNQVAWSTEVTLDVDMAHAIAPNANIALVIAPSDDNKPLDYAIAYAINNRLGSTISLSWGTSEAEIVTKHDVREAYFANTFFKCAAARGITIFASAGDWGSSNGADFNNALFPASSPYVTAVGGTNLFMTCMDGYQEGTGSWDGQNHFGVQYYYEIAGNDYQAMAADGFPMPMDLVTTGGTQSYLFDLPSWQKGITLTYANGTTVKPTGRCIADVSFDSGVYGGLGAIFLSASSPGTPIMTVVGGTSSGSPFWAALTAIANQYSKHNVGFINPELYQYKNANYQAGAFHDVTVGDNTSPGSTVMGYQATAGWDAPTGIGSPDAAIFVAKITKESNTNNGCHNNYEYSFDYCHFRD
jgi:subtilase family serine protease